METKITMPDSMVFIPMKDYEKLANGEEALKKIVEYCEGIDKGLAPVFLIEILKSHELIKSE